MHFRKLRKIHEHKTTGVDIFNRSRLSSVFFTNIFDIFNDIIQINSNNYTFLISTLSTFIFLNIYKIDTD